MVQMMYNRLIPMPSSYPLPWIILLRLCAAYLRRRSLSFQEESRLCMARLPQNFRVSGRENIPPCGPYLLTTNHYTRRGLPAWWLAISISSVVPADIHWIITSGWIFNGSRYAGPFEASTHWAFRRVARVYGFTTMPPMPPRASETAARAGAVREVLAYARAAPQAVIGLAPEGRDTPGGVLCWPPPGAGRFILHMAEAGPILPVGVFEQDDCLRLNFGPPYRLRLPGGISADQCDYLARRKVMQAIAQRLPESMRAEFGGPL